MPEQQHPPYASGSLTIPRTLLRWLDINFQNGPLARTSTYITLPSFVGNGETWNGFSDIVTSFNFEGPNNFSLVGITTPPAINFTLCISYRIGNTLYRYIIWKASGTVLPQNIPFYSGQKILKNFRLEVWSTSQGNATLSSPINFYTSVKGQVDYRYGVDSTLVNNDGQQINFSAKLGLVTIPTNNLQYQLDARIVTTTGGQGTTVLGWADQKSHVNFTPSPGGLLGVSWNTDPIFHKDIVTINTGNTIVGTGVGANPGTIAIAFTLMSTSSTQTLFNNSGGMSLTYNQVTGKFVTFGDSSSNISPAASTPYLVIMYPNEGYTEIYNLQTGILLDKFYGSSSTGPDGTITLGAFMFVWEILAYNNDSYGTSDYYNLTGYFFSKYGGAFLLPLTFPAGSTSTTN